MYNNKKVFPKVLWASIICNILSLFVLLVIVGTMISIQIQGILQPILPILYPIYIVFPRIPMFGGGYLGDTSIHIFSGFISLIAAIIALRKIRKDSQMFRGKVLALVNLTFSIIVLLYYPLLILIFLLIA